MATKEKPVISKTEFDSMESTIRAALSQWWKAEQRQCRRPPLNGATATVWSKLPVVDSKTMARASPIVRKHLGAGIDPKLIRKGGYSSFDEALDDLMPQLRATCPDDSAESATAA